MSFTRVVGPGIHTQSNIDSHNIKSTGIITATKFDGPFDSLTVSGNLSIGGTLTYEDVTNIDSVGLITARKGIISSGVVTATAFHGASQVGIQSGGVQIGAGITQLNFVGTGNTFAVNGTTVDISIQVVVELVLVEHGVHTLLVLQPLNQLELTHRLLMILI